MPNGALSGYQRHFPEKIAFSEQCQAEIPIASGLINFDGSLLDEIHPAAVIPLLEYDPAGIDLFGWLGYECQDICGRLRKNGLHTTRWRRPRYVFRSMPFSACFMMTEMLRILAGVVTG